MKCGKCKKTAYCSKECQKADSKLHKVICGVSVHTGMARHISAIVDAKHPMAKDEAVQKFIAKLFLAMLFDKGLDYVPSTREEVSTYLVITWMGWCKKVPESLYLPDEDKGGEHDRLVANIEERKDGDEAMDVVKGLMPDRAPLPHLWLHGRDHADIYALLTDAYRLYFVSVVDNDLSRAEIEVAWLFFNQQAFAKQLTPTNWTPSDSAKCVRYGKSDNSITNIYSAGEPAEIS